MGSEHRQRGRASASRNTDGQRLWPPPAEGWLAIAAVTLIYLGHWSYGAVYSDAALVLVLAAAIVLGAVLVRTPLRADLLRLRGLIAPGVLLLIVIAVGLWTLTPLVPGGPHPVWSYSGVGAPASTIDKSATAVELVKLLGLACVFLIGAATGARDARARYAVRLTLAVGCAFGLWAFIASTTGAIYQSQGHRLEARFLNPNTAGTVFAVLFLLGLAELRRELRIGGRDKLTRALAPASAALIFVVCLLTTASRGAAMGAIGGGVVFILVQLAAGSLKPSRAVLAAFGGLAFLLALVALTGERLIDRLFESQEASLGRTEIWRRHWEAFLDSPLLGYGLGTADTVNRTLLSQESFEVLWNIRAILNVYLQWLEEAGLLGALPMFACIWLLIFSTVRGTLRRNRMTGLLAALLGVDAVFLIHGATDFGLQVYSVAALWAWLLGLQLALSQGSSRR